jgi:hypothetical protein
MVIVSAAFKLKILPEKEFSSFRIKKLGEVSKFIKLVPFAMIRFINFGNIHGSLYFIASTKKKVLHG